MKKRVMGFLLAVTMVLSLCPAFASAASTNDVGYLAYMGQFAGKTVNFNSGPHHCGNGTDSQTCNICSWTMVLSNKLGKQLDPWDVYVANGQKVAVNYGALARAYGFTVDAKNYQSDNWITVKNKIISLLNDHPEGVIVGYSYYGGKNADHYVVAKQIINGEVYFNDPSPANKCNTGRTIDQCWKNPPWINVRCYYVINGANSSGSGGSGTPSVTVDKNIYLSNAAEPKEPLKQGTIFNVTGKLSSALAITKVEVYVYDSNNKAVTGKTVTPNTTSYNLASVDNDVKFSKLSPGSYKYKVTAYNSSGSKTLIDRAFRVYGKPTGAWIKVSTEKTTSSSNVTLTWGATDAERYDLDVTGDRYESDKNAYIGTYDNKLTRKYAPGYYTAVLTARNSMGTSDPVKVNFVISDVTTSDSIPNGTYYILNLQGQSFDNALTVDEGTIANKLNVSCKSRYSSGRQKFMLERQTDGSYLIKLNNNYALDVYSGAKNANLDLWKIGSDTENSKFYLEKSGKFVDGNDLYTLHSKKTGQRVRIDSKTGNALLSNSYSQFVLAKAVEGISLSENKVSFSEIGTYDLSSKLKVTPENAYDKEVIWHSSDESIATVSKGIVTAQAPGECTVTVSSKDGNYSASCDVVVEKDFDIHGKCGDNISWQIKENTSSIQNSQGQWETVHDTILILSGSGNMKNYESSNEVPWHRNSENITSIVIGNDITSIGSYAFSGLENIKKITVPANVERIGQHAFEGCGEVEKLALPESVYYNIGSYAFNDCQIEKISYQGTNSYLEYVVKVARENGGNDCLADAEWFCTADENRGVDGVDRNGKDCYWMLSTRGVLTYYSDYRVGSMPDENPLSDYYIQEIIIDPDDETTKAFYMSDVFEGCETVTKLTVCDTVTRLGSMKNCTHLEEAYLPDTLDSVGSGMFANCYNLKSVRLPEKGDFTWGVYDGGSMFLNCYSLEHIDLPSNMTSIPNSMFMNCEGIKTLDIPENITEIGNSAFLGSGITELVIPEHVTSLGSQCFAHCNNIRSVEIPATVTKASDSIFRYCENLESIVIPGDLGFDWHAFAQCTSLKSVSFSSPRKGLGSFMFQGCTSLESIDLSNCPITDLSQYTFAYCTSLKTIQLPATVSSVSWCCFDGCESLENVVFSGNEDQWNAMEIKEYNEPLLDAKITFLNACTISIEEDTDDIVAVDGQKVEIRADVAGEGIETQPQVSSDGGETWSHVLPEDDDEENTALNTNAKLRTMSKSTEAETCSITVTADIDNPDQCYRFEVTDKTGSVRYTHPVTVIVVKGSSAIDNLDNQTVEVGDAVTFSVQSNDEEDLKYQWMQCDPDANDWKNSEYQGNTTATLTVTATEENAGTQFKCIVTDQNDVQTESDVAIIDVKRNIEILDQPFTTTGEVGYDTSLWINVYGTDLSYRWELVEDDGDKWIPCDYEGSDTNELVIPVSEDTYDQQFRCVITDRYGNQVTSEAGAVILPEGTIEETEDNNVATLKSHTLSLTGNIGIIYNFYLSEETLNDSGAKVQFTIPGGEQSEVPVSKGVKKTDKNGQDYYGYSCDVHSSQMTGDVTAKIVLSDGRESEEFHYTVKQYADIIITNKNNSAAYTEVTPLVKAMLNYGGYAQEFFNYDPSASLANKDLTAEEKDVSSVQAADLAQYATVKKGTAPEGISYKSATLILTSKTSIRYSFRLAEGHDISEFTFKNGNQVLTPYHLSDNVYCVEIPDIASSELDEMYTVSVGAFSVTYGALTYAYNKLKAETTATNPETLKNLLRALVLYNQEANKYFV